MLLLCHLPLASLVVRTQLGFELLAPHKHWKSRKKKKNVLFLRFRVSDTLTWPPNDENGMLQVPISMHQTLNHSVISVFFKAFFSFWVAWFFFVAPGLIIVDFCRSMSGSDHKLDSSFISFFIGKVKYLLNVHISNETSAVFNELLPLHDKEAHF